MGELNNILQQIKNGNVENLNDDVQTLLSSTNETKSSENILRHCSRYAYENTKVAKEYFHSMLDAVVRCCQHQKQQEVVDSGYQIKSIYYILSAICKRRDSYQYLPQILSDASGFVAGCDASTGDVFNLCKNIYQSVWNASLSQPCTPQESLDLQRWSLYFLLVIGTSLDKVCEQAFKAATNYEQKSQGNPDKFYLQLLLNITTTSKTKEYDSKSIIALLNLILKYAVSLAKHKNFSEFTKGSRPFVTLLEGRCSDQVMMSLKVGLKLVEAAMALLAGKFTSEKLMDYIYKTQGVIPNSEVPNAILILCLLQVIAFFEKPNENEILYSVEPSVIGTVLSAALVRFSRSTSEESTKQLGTIISQLLASYLDIAKKSPYTARVYEEALKWVTKATKFLIDNNQGWQIKNYIGVNAGNFGVLSYRENKYDAAAKFLESCVNLLESCTTETSSEVQGNIISSMLKKQKLLSDALRYSGAYYESGLALAVSALKGGCTKDDLILNWVKCKRDAAKAGNTQLKGLTILDIVNEAQKKCKNPKIKFDVCSLLLFEVYSYRKQSHAAAEDELSCAAALLGVATTVVHKVRALLLTTQVLWTQPTLASQENQAINTVKQAQGILNDAKKLHMNESGIEEVEALTNFWIYLCRLQLIQEKAQIEFEETMAASAAASSLTSAATDLGEEIQADDVCDVRPATTSLTLHQQDRLLHPLNKALLAWENLLHKGSELKDANSTCAAVASAGYIYQLSGLTLPTVRTWKVLITMAQTYKLNTYIIQGIGELMMTGPEFVTPNSAHEVQQLLATQESTQSGNYNIYHNLTTRTALAYYYLTRGEYELGSEQLLSVMNHDVMEKNTVRGTEVQVLVNYVASRYSRLAPWLLPESLRAPLTDCCIHLAVMACRKANAVMETHSQAVNTEVLCLSHRILWLNIITDAWLGRLCVDTVQPRLGRAYLKDSLALSQKFALPIRTAELLETLAQVDLLCEQLEDCRVKVDSLESLLVAHPTGLKDAHAPVSTSSLLKKTCSGAVKAMAQSPMIVIMADSDINERIRDCATEDVDFELSTSTADVEKWPEPKQRCPSSPSTKYREESSQGRLESCPHQLVDCLVCSSLVVHQLRISSALLCAALHSRQNRHQAAIAALTMAKKRYKVTTENSASLSNLYSNYLMKTIIKTESNNGLSNFESYITSSMCKVRLQYKYIKVEILAINQKWKEAEDSNIDALEWINALEKKLLHQEMHYILVFIVQGSKIQEALKEVADKAAAIAAEECKENNSTPPIVFFGKTPGSIFSEKTPQNQNLDKITASHNKVKNYNIYSDDEDDDHDVFEEAATPFKEQESKLNKKNASKTQVERKSTQTSRVKSRVGHKKDEDICALQSKIEKLNLDDTSSPTDIVFKVPTMFSDSRTPAASIYGKVRSLSDIKTPAASISAKVKSQKKQLEVPKQSKIETLNLDDTSSPTELVFKVPTMFSDSRTPAASVYGKVRSHSDINMPAASISAKEKSQKKQVEVPKNRTLKNTTKISKVKVSVEESSDDDVEIIKLELSSSTTEDDVKCDSPEVIESPEKPKTRGRPRKTTTEDCLIPSERKSSRTASTSAASKSRTASTSAASKSRTASTSAASKSRTASTSAASKSRTASTSAASKSRTASISDVSKSRTASISDESKSRTASTSTASKSRSASTSAASKSRLSRVLR